MIYRTKCNNGTLCCCWSITAYKGLQNQTTGYLKISAEILRQVQTKSIRVYVRLLQHVHVRNRRNFETKETHFLKHNV